MPTSSASTDYILGIDLGSNSVGWAMIGLSQKKPAGLLRAGVRVFDAGMEGDLESGQEESRNVARRGARMQRRHPYVESKSPARGGAFRGFSPTQVEPAY